MMNDMISTVTSEDLQDPVFRQYCLMTNRYIGHMWKLSHFHLWSAKMQGMYREHAGVPSEKMFDFEKYVEWLKHQ